MKKHSYLFVLLLWGVAYPAFAQTDASIMLAPWDEDQQGQHTAGWFYTPTEASTTNADVDLSIFDATGRVRLDPGSTYNPTIGYELVHFEIGSSDAALPDDMTDVSVAFGGSFGDLELGARLVAIVSVGIVSLAIHRTAMALLGDHRVAALSVYWFNLTPGGMLGLFVITPDAPSMLFWALALRAAAELHAARDGRWWLAFGLFAGLGLASKYTGLFLGAGIALWLLAHRENRHWFASPYLYAGGALALAIFAPVIAWNLDNGLSSFAFQFGRAGDVDLSLRDLLHLPEFIAAQAGGCAGYLDGSRRKNAPKGV